MNPERKFRYPMRPAFTLVELLVVIVILGILATLAIPTVTCGPISGVMTGTLNNARQLHLATQMMTLDTENVGAGMDWTSVKTKGIKKTEPARWPHISMRWFGTTS